jgi:hypothetical protein
MKNAICALALAASLLPAGEMKVFPAPNVDYSRYKTFTVSPPRLATRQGVIENDDTIIPALRAAAARHMSAKGFTEVPSGGDITVQVGGIGSGTLTVDALLMTWGVDFYYGYYGPTSYTPIQRFNKEGTVVIGLVDTKTKKGLWAGFATEGLGGRGGIEKTVNDATTRIFKKFPPKK